MAANRGAVERFEDTIEDILLYLRHGFSIFEELNRNSFTNDSNVAEILIFRCEEFVCGLSLLYRLVQWPVDIKQYFQEVMALFQERISRILERLNIEEGGNYSCPKINDNGGIGRPKFLITKEQIDGLRSLHFSWKKIAEMLGVSDGGKNLTWPLAIQLCTVKLMMMNWTFLFGISFITLRNQVNEC